MMASEHAGGAAAFAVAVFLGGHVAQPHQDGDRAFLPPKWRRWKSAAMTGLFAAATVAGVWVPLRNPDGSFTDPWKDALIDGCLGTVLIASSLYVMASFVRSRLVLSADGMRLVTAFTDGTFRFDEVVSARWQPVYLGGSIRLRTARWSTTLQFDWFVDGRDIPPILRRAIPPDQQLGFDRYEAMTAAQVQRRRRLPPGGRQAGRDSA